MFYHVFVSEVSPLAGSRIFLFASHRSTQFFAIVCLHLKPVMKSKLAREAERAGLVAP